MRRFVLVLLIALLAVHRAEAAGEPPASPTASPTPAKDLEYSSKHFSLSLGATILNPFSISSCSSTNSTNCATPLATPPGMKLDTNNGTSARGFIEVGYRHHWAWETEGLLDLPAATKAKADADAAVAKADAAATKAKTEAQNNPADETKAKASADAAQTKTAADAADADATAALNLAVGLNKKGWPSLFFWNEGLPISDLEFRMGYVFSGSTTPSGASAIVGGSDVYTQIIPSFPIVGFSYGDKPNPALASVNLDASMGFSSDRSLGIIHQQYLFGPALVIGSPLSPAAAKANAAAKTAADDSSEATDTANKVEQAADAATDKGLDTATTKKMVDAVATAKANAKAKADAATTAKQAADDAGNVSPVEFIVRGGAAYVDVPRFLDKTSRQIAVKNGEPDFHGGWGGGVEMEVNVPVSKQLGYIMARADMFTSPTPNLWSLQLGYTIPLATLASAVTGK